MSRQEKELDAAEYVIGTMSAVERTAFEVSIETDEDTRKDVSFWDRAFGSLTASISPVPVPDHIWPRIEKALPLSGAPGEAATSAPATSAQTKPVTAANDNAIEDLKKGLRRWRFRALAASLIAVGLGAYLANETLNIVPIPGRDRPDEIVAQGAADNEFVAVVSANGDQPSLIVSVNTDTGDVSVRSLGIEKPEGKSLELWYVPEGQKAVSVGLVGEGEIDLKDLTAKTGDLLAISIEPVGGSPTGTATGPVVYTGKLVSTK